MINSVNNINMNSFIAQAVGDTKTASDRPCRPLKPILLKPTHVQRFTTTNKIDTVEFSQKKKHELSKGIILVGSLICLAFCMLKVPKIKGLDFVQLPEHLDFKNSQTMQDAIKFAKETFGIELQVGENLKLANIVNYILVELSNKCKGKVALPKILNSTPLEDKVLGSFSCGKSTLSLSQNHYNIEDLPSIEVIDSLMKRMPPKMDKNIEKLISTFAQLRGTIFHELGHASHSASNIKIYLNDEVDFIKVLGGDYNEIENFFKIYSGVVKDGSVYAFKNACEYVAETFMLMMKGIKIPENIMNFYKKFGGYVPVGF